MTGRQRSRPGRRLSTALLIAGAVALPVLTGATTSVAGTASAASTSEAGNPIADQGSSYDYRSELTGITPKLAGLEVQVLEFADRLLLINHTGQTVTIYGYEGEPYARILANGTAEQNERSPATYLNTNFYADVTVPVSATAKAAPDWVVVDRTGQFEWHDHRIHWMSPIPPAKVKDRSRRTLIFDWRVPIEVGSRKGVIAGQLFWTPESSKASTTVIAAGIVIALLGLLFVLYVRRRRARAPATTPAGAEGPEPPRKEAW